MEKQPKRPFGRLVLDAGLATREQITACLGEMRHRQAHGEQVSLGQVMLERGILTRQEILRILKNQDKTVMQCEKCGRRYNIIGYRVGAEYRCRYDEAPLQPQITDVTAGGELVTDHDLVAETLDLDATMATVADAAASASAERAALESAGSTEAASEPFQPAVTVADESGQTTTGDTIDPGEPIPDAKPRPTPAAHAVADESALLAPDERIIGRIGDFLLTRVLGRGGMGDVYLGRNRMIHGLFAIKILSQEKAKNEQYRERFLREARLANRLDHPNVVKVWDVGAIEGYFFIVMEYIDGQTLRERVEERGPLPISDAVGIAIQTLRGIEAAHAAGIIHRDLKPANIMLRADGLVKVFDFGLALPVDRTTKKLTLQGQTFGTPHFMSPEQIYNKQIDHRTDLYSLGATLYYSLTGSYPFPGVKALEVLFKRMNEKPVPITERRQDLPPGLVTVVNQLMADAPDQRHESAYAARKALEPWAVR